jgi:hypothetical protein
VAPAASLASSVVVRGGVLLDNPDAHDNAVTTVG